MPLGFRSKIDSNQSEIINHLRKCGWSVTSLASVGKGCPDVVVGVDGVNVLLELKVHGEKLNKIQLKWHGSWLGTVYVVYTPREAEFVCMAAAAESRRAAK